MEYQLRRSRIKPGRMSEFLDAWLAGVYPLRKRFGFRFVGAWVVEASDEFVWILGYEGPEGFAAAMRGTTRRPSGRPCGRIPRSSSPRATIA